VPAAPLTAVGVDKTGPSGLPNRTVVRFFLFRAGASGSCPIRVAIGVSHVPLVPLLGRRCPRAFAWWKVVGGEGAGWLRLEWSFWAWWVGMELLGLVG
jgi:hypothetical protein